MYRSILFLLFAILLIDGCSSDSTTSSIIGTNLFPLSVGNKYEYNQYDIDSSYVQITGTDRKFTREIGSPVYIDGFYAYPMYETSYTSSGSIDSKDTTYVYNLHNDTLYYYMKFTIPISNTSNIVFNKWAPVFARGGGVDAYYNILDTTINITSTVNGSDILVPFHLNIQDYIYNQETLVVPEQSAGYKANMIDMFYTLSISGIKMRTGTYYQIWFAEGVGAIKERRFYIEQNKGRNIELTAKTIK